MFEYMKTIFIRLSSTLSSIINLGVHETECKIISLFMVSWYR